MPPSPRDCFRRCLHPFLAQLSTNRVAIDIIVYDAGNVVQMSTLLQESTSPQTLQSPSPQFLRLHQLATLKVNGYPRMAQVLLTHKGGALSSHVQSHLHM